MTALPGIVQGVLWAGGGDRLSLGSSHARGALGDTRTRTDGSGTRSYGRPVRSRPSRLAGPVQRRPGALQGAACAPRGRLARRVPLLRRAHDLRRRRCSTCRTGGKGGGVRVNPKLLSERELGGLCRFLHAQHRAHHRPGDRRPGARREHLGARDGLDGGRIQPHQRDRQPGRAHRQADRRRRFAPAATPRPAGVGCSRWTTSRRRSGWTREKIRIAVKGLRQRAGSWFAGRSSRSSSATASSRCRTRRARSATPRASTRVRCSSTSANPGASSTSRRPTRSTGTTSSGLDCRGANSLPPRSGVHQERERQERVRGEPRARGQPELPGADRRRARPSPQRSITVVPDILASAGGVVVSATSNGSRTLCSANAGPGSA